jgi:hypothetical protein
MFVRRLLALIADHPHAAYLAIFLSARAESLACVGLRRLGTVLMLGSGALVATGVLSLPARGGRICPGSQNKNECA